MGIGGGIPIHRHLQMDEAFSVLEGSGVFSLNDVSYPIEKAATIFIPKNAWHGFTTPDNELLLLWVRRLLVWMAFFAKPAIRPAQR
jgi:mannose-6-phosphate isomerase-like protein (cupin superfamily)